MKRTSLNALFISIGLSIFAATLVAILWGFGLLASAQAAFAPRGLSTAPPVPLGSPLVLILIFTVAAATGTALMLFGGRRALPFVLGGIALLGVLSFVLSRLVGTDIAFAPIALAALGGALFVQIYHLARLDDRLSRYVEGVVKRVYARPEAETKSPGLMTALKLLETVLPLGEAIVLRFGENDVLEPTARLQQSTASAAMEPGRNYAWREGVILCERAIATRSLVIAAPTTPASTNATPTQPSNAAPESTSISTGTGAGTLQPSATGESGGGNNTGVVASVAALPLIHEGQMMGALLVRFRENFNDEDRPLLAAVGAQLAQDIHRDGTRAKAVGRQYPALFSAQAAERRLKALGVVGDLLRKERLVAGVIEEMPDAHAVAYLDGTIIYANTNMLRAANVKDDEIAALDLFSLLDRFRAGVFDSPAIAVRRVLQTGGPYERELFYPEINQTLALRIALVNEQTTNGQALQPLCFTVSISDVTGQKEFVNLKSDMVSLMSHELRTPITSINGFAELLVIDESLSEEQREFLMIIRSESQRLSRMLDTFLAVSKLEAGDKQSVTKAPLLVNDLVQELIASLQPIAKKKRIRLMAQPVPGLPPVAADRGLITQVISNLIDNAIKYSPERTTVTVSTALEADAVRIAVEDRGYGIPPESIDRVWEKFYRVAREGQEKDEDSTGLGLSFVREVVEQHGGQVHLESEHGRGSVFGFTLPRL